MEFKAWLADFSFASYLSHYVVVHTPWASRKSDKIERYDASFLRANEMSVLYITYCAPYARPVSQNANASNRGILEGRNRSISPSAIYTVLHLQSKIPYNFDFFPPINRRSWLHHLITSKFHAIQFDIKAWVSSSLRALSLASR